jgi:hypothetical protein
VLAEYHETCERYGDVLPEELRREAAEIRARAPRIRKETDIARRAV